MSILIRLNGCVAIPCQVIEIGTKLNLVVQGLIPSNGFARVSGVTTENRGKRTLGSIVSLVVDFTLCERVDKIELLLLVPPESFAAKTPSAVVLAEDC